LCGALVGPAQFSSLSHDVADVSVGESIVFRVGVTRIGTLAGATLDRLEVDFRWTCQERQAEGARFDVEVVRVRAMRGSDTCDSASDRPEDIERQMKLVVDDVFARPILMTAGHFRGAVRSREGRRPLARLAGCVGVRDEDALLCAVPGIGSHTSFTSDTMTARALPRGGFGYRASLHGSGWWRRGRDLPRVGTASFDERGVLKRLEERFTDRGTRFDLTWSKRPANPGRGRLDLVGIEGGG